MDSVLLSHWKSQSFFNEMYTDLYDFCFCLSNKIEELEAGGSTSTELTAIRQACGKVMDLLVKEESQGRRVNQLGANYCCLRFIGTGISVFAWAVSLFSMAGAFKR